MATGDSPEMQRMQEEAIRRAREMQSRATAAVEEEEDTPPKKASAKKTGTRGGTQSRQRAKPKAADEPEDLSKPAEVQGGITGSGTTSLLDSLFKDKDRTLILMLLILIGGDSENHELMFALLFLLM